MPEPLKIPYQVRDLDAIPQPLRVFFTERDGTYHLNLDGDHPDTARLSEFRENNRSLNGLKADLESKLKPWTELGLEPAAVKSALEELQTLKKQATGASEHEAKLAELTAQLDRRTQELQATRFQMVLGGTARKEGFRPDALDYLAYRAEQAGFGIDATGKVTSKTVGADGTPLSLEAWLRSPEFRPLQEPSRGGGASTAGSGAAAAPPRVSRFDVASVGRHLEQIATGQMTLSD